MNLAIEAIEQLSQEPRRDGEGALPSLGVILERVRVLREPVGDVRHIIRTLAKVYGAQMDESLLTAYEEVLGHRTLEDLATAKTTILKDADRKRMPTPGEMLKACGTLFKKRGSE